MRTIISTFTKHFLTCFLVVSLTACGSSTSEGHPVSASTPRPTKEPVAVTAEPKEEVTAEPEPTEEPQVVEETAAPEPAAEASEPAAAPAIDPSGILDQLGADPSKIVESLSGGLSGLASLISSSSYEDIYNEYSKKITDASPKLIEEYKKEAASNTNGIEGLAEIANSKVEQLAELDAEGTEAMVQFMYTKGAGNYEDYEAWATKLYEVYNTEATKIYNEYMASVY